MPRPAKVVFIHGLANKPEPRQLRRIWLEALAKPEPGDPGFDLGAVGVAAEFVYWANHFYDTPLSASDYESAPTRNAQLDAMTEEVATGPGDAAWLRALAANYPEAFEDAPVSEDETTASAAELEYERIPLPGPLKKKLMASHLREAHDYLYDRDGIRGTLRNEVVAALDSIPDDHLRILVGHSQGSFIAYDVLTGVDACPRVDGFLTLGSPLGVDEVQDRLVWSRHNGFPGKLAGDWVNVYDSFDIVARPDPRLANDFRRNGQEVVIDVKENNWGRWRHSATKYLRGPKLRSHLRTLCGRPGA